VSLGMNPEIRARWCAALRSGNYRQGQKMLRAGDSYCCLGVLCDLAVRAGILGEPVLLTTGDEDEQWWYYDSRCDYLPGAVKEWAGLPDSNPEVRFRGEKTWLAEINDSGCTFAEIADVIDGGTS
jgi:hypothetical protein